MDFSWVRQLAEESNQHELDKQEAERRKLIEGQLTALVTVPFVEKLFMLIQACSDEFNKHCMFQDLRVNLARGVSKRAKGSYDNIHTPPDENAYFSFARRSTMYGVRGVNGTVEFVEDIKVSDVSSALSLRLDEMSVSVGYKLISKVEYDANDPNKRSVVWLLNDEVMDGPRLMSLCQHYFMQFIKRTDD